MAERQKVDRSGVDTSFFQATRAARTARRADDLHVCPSCESSLVYPTDWEPAESTRWRVELRCPDCEWSGGGIYDQDTVDRFDEELDRGTESVLEDLQAMTRANMEEQIDTFVTALQADLILPEDF
jgi:hypothetical protein